MADTFRTTITDVDSPAANAFMITDIHVPDGSSIESGGVLLYTTRALYVGITGNVYCRMANSYNPNPDVNDDHGANVHFQSIPAGTILPLRIQAIWANNYTNDTSNTTARGLVGLY